MVGSFVTFGGALDPGQYREMLAGSYREICGEDVGFSQAFDDFVGGLGREGGPANQQLLRGVMKGTAEPLVADSAYRRFLNRGAGCREGSPGHQRWLSIRDTRSLPPEQITPLLSGGIAVAGRVAIGTPEGLVSPSEAGAVLALAAEENPLTADGIPRLVRLGVIAYDGSSTQPFGDVIATPASAGAPAVTIIRGITGYHASVLVDGAYAGDVSLADDYARRIETIQDPQAFVAAWNEYVRVVFERIQELMPIVADLAEAQRQGSDPPAEDVIRAFAPLKAAYNAAAAFRRSSSSPLFRTGEYLFVATQRARLNNYAGYFLSPLELYLSGSDDDPEFQVIPEVLKLLPIIMDIFDHLHFSYGKGGSSKDRLEVELPSPPTSILPANPLALRRIVDEIVYQAGRVSPGGEQKGKLRVEWDPASGELAFIDAEEAVPVLDAFRDPNEQPALMLARLVPELGTGSALHISTDFATGRVTRIGIVVPLQGATGSPPPGSGQSGEGSPSAGGADSPQTPPAPTAPPPASLRGFAEFIVVPEGASVSTVGDPYEERAADPLDVTAVNAALTGGAALLCPTATAPAPLAAP